MKYQEPKTCASCRFFLPFDPSIPEDDGYCRRHAPRAVPMARGDMARMGVNGDDMVALWPVVSPEADDWCGEHKENE